LKELLLGLHPGDGEIALGEFGLEGTDVIKGFLEEKDLGRGLVDDIGNHLAEVIEAVLE